jgi:hypothetical protein
MANLSRDPWIKAHSPIDAEKLHALGVVNFRWNITEFILKIFSMRFGGGGKGSFDANWAELHDEGDIALWQMIEANVTAGPWSQDIKDAVIHGIRMYEACRINRNQLSHFLPKGLAGSDLARLKGPDFDPQPFPDSLADIRRVAEEIEALIAYLGGLFNFFRARFQNALRRAPTPLPAKPPLPKTLWHIPPPPPKPRRRKARQKS